MQAQNQPATWLHFSSTVTLQIKAYCPVCLGKVETNITTFQSMRNLKMRVICKNVKAHHRNLMMWIFAKLLWNYQNLQRHIKCHPQTPGIHISWLTSVHNKAGGVSGPRWNENQTQINNGSEESGEVQGSPKGPGESVE